MAGIHLCVPQEWEVRRENGLNGITKMYGLCEQWISHDVLPYLLSKIKIEAFVYRVSPLGTCTN